MTSRETNLAYKFDYEEVSEGKKLEDELKTEFEIQLLIKLKNLSQEKVSTNFNNLLQWLVKTKMQCGHSLWESMISVEIEEGLLDIAKTLGFNTDGLNINGLLGIFELNKIYQKLKTNPNDFDLDLFYQYIQILISKFPEQKNFLYEMCDKLNQKVTNVLENQSS